MDEKILALISDIRRDLEAIATAAICRLFARPGVTPVRLQKQPLSGILALRCA